MFLFSGLPQTRTEGLYWWRVVWRSGEITLTLWVPVCLLFACFPFLYFFAQLRVVFSASTPLFILFNFNSFFLISILPFLLCPLSEARLVCLFVYLHSLSFPSPSRICVSDYKPTTARVSAIASMVSMCQVPILWYSETLTSEAAVQSGGVLETCMLTADRHSVEGGWQVHSLMK